MKSKYNKPRMRVVPLQGHHNLLEPASQTSGVNVKMSGYTSGGDGTSGSDGWGD